MAKKKDQAASNVLAKGRGARGKRAALPSSSTRWDAEAERRKVVNERREEISEPVELDVTPDNVLRVLARLAFYDPRNVHAVDGSLKRLNELDLVTASALAGVDVNLDGSVLKYKLANRVPALDMLGKYLKLFEGDVKDKGALDALLEEFRKQYAIATKENDGHEKETGS